MLEKNKFSTLILVMLIIYLFSSCNQNNKDFDLIPVKSGNKWGFVNTKGKFEINPQFSSACSFTDGLAKVRSLGNNPKYGYIDKEGKYIINPIYTSATAFSDGIACVTTKNSEPIYIDTEGKQLFSIKEALSAYTFTDGLGVFSENVVSENGKDEKLFGFVDKTGHKVIPAQFYDVEPFNCGMAAVMNSDNLWGFINKEGRIVINFQFEKTELFSEDKAVVFNGENWGVINIEGKYIINPIYEKLSMFKDNKAIYIKDGKRGFIDDDGNIIIEAQFDKAKLFNSGFACVKVNGMWGYIDDEGKYIINPQFKEASSFFGDIAFVKSGDKYGIIDKEGMFVANPQFNDLYSIIIDFPTFYNVGIISYNDLYVRSNFYDIDKIINGVVNDISEESVNNLSKNSGIEDVLEYFNGLSDSKTKLSSISNSDKNVNSKYISISKDVKYKIYVYFNKRILTYGNSYDKSYKRIINQSNSLRKIKFKVKLSGKALKKSDQIFESFLSKVSFLGDDKNSNTSKAEFYGKEYNCYISLNDNSIDLIFDLNKNKRIVETPQEVAELFMNSIHYQDYDTAKELGTENTVMMVGMIESMAGLSGNEKIEETEIIWGETEINGNFAICYYKEIGKDREQQIDLKKVNGEWKVDLKKEN